MKTYKTVYTWFRKQQRKVVCRSLVTVPSIKKAMPTLQDSIEKALQDAPYMAFRELIASKLQHQGLNLSEKEKQRISDAILSGDIDRFRLRPWRWWEKKTATIEITDEDIKKIDSGLSDFLEGDLPRFVDELSSEIAPDILASLRRRWPTQRRIEDKQRRSFNRDIVKHWNKPIDSLRFFVTISRELVGAAVPVAQDDQGSYCELLSVQMRLHARACQIAEEIVCLLSAGFADGALARWRTIHEIAVVSLFLSEHGEDVARCYVDHDAVESYKAAVEYEKHREALGYEPISPEDIVDLKQARDVVVAKYGAAFKTQYGWAADALNSARPTFADIERAVGIDYLRAYYRLASHQVHSNPKGIFFKLGLMEEVDMLLAGPSNFGLADPGQNTAVSLLQVTISLVMASPTLDGIVGTKILTMLVEGVCSSFADAQNAFGTRSD